MSLLSYLAVLLWHWSELDDLQKGFSQNMRHGRERERRLERGLVSECFIISNVAFPEALSKVSEQCEPGLEMFNPLVTTWSKATLHFLIFALKREPLHGLCVWTHWCFLSDLIFPRMFRSAGLFCLRRGTWYDQNRGNILRMINRQSVANIFKGRLPSKTNLKWILWVWFDRIFGTQNAIRKLPTREIKQHFNTFGENRTRLYSHIRRKHFHYWLFNTCSFT